MPAGVAKSGKRRNHAQVQQDKERLELMNLREHFGKRNQREYRATLKREFRARIDVTFVLRTLEVLENELANGVEDLKRITEINMIKEIQIAKLDRVLPKIKAIEFKQNTAPNIIFQDPMAAASVNTQISHMEPTTWNNSGEVIDVPDSTTGDDNV